MNSPRFLVASDPDGEHFANSIVAVQTQAPLRVLHVDLDNVYDPDPAQQARNLDQLVQRVVDMGAGTVFLQAFADPKGDGLVHRCTSPTATCRCAPTCSTASPGNCAPVPMPACMRGCRC
jgi:biofilm PGA synthesis lipoprotein PgaB